MPVIRTEWSDIVKAFAVMLVVWNHSATGITQFPLPHSVREATEFFHLFNLSSFFLVAGLFVCSSVRKDTGSYIWNLVRLVYYPMVLWSVLQGTIYALAGDHVQYPTPIWEPLLTSWYQPHKQMGFLLSLLAGRLLFLAADRLRVPWWGMGIFAMAGIVIYGGMWADPPRTIIAPDSLMWMCIGAGLSAMGGLRVIDRMPRSIVLASFLGTASAAVAMYALWPEPITASYYSLSLLRLLGMASVVLLAIFVSKLGRMPILTYIGQHSLQIFLAHLIFVGGFRLFLTKIAGMDQALPVALACFALGIAAPLTLHRIFGNRWLFELPAGRRHDPASSVSRGKIFLK